jgi:hypothetical protein
MYTACKLPVDQLFLPRRSVKKTVSVTVKIYFFLIVFLPVQDKTILTRILHHNKTFYPTPVYYEVIIMPILNILSGL